MLTDLKATLNKSVSPGLKPPDPIERMQTLGGPMTKKDSGRQKRMNAFKKGTQSLILPHQNLKIQLLKPSMSSIAIRKCGLEKIEDGLDEA